MDGKEFYKLFCCDRKKAIEYLLLQDENDQKRLINWKTQDHQTVLHQIAKDGDTTYLSTILNLVDEKILNTEYVYTPLMESIINDNASVSFVLLKHPLVDINTFRKGSRLWKSAIHYAALYTRNDILVYLIEKVRDRTIKFRNNEFDLIVSLCSLVLKSEKKEEECLVCIQTLLSFAHQQFGNRESFITLLSKHVVPDLVKVSFADILTYLIKEYGSYQFLINSPYGFLNEAFGSSYYSSQKVDSKTITLLFSYLYHLHKSQPLVYTSLSIFKNWVGYLVRSIKNVSNEQDCFLILSAFLLLLEDEKITEEQARSVCGGEFSTYIYRSILVAPKDVNPLAVSVSCLSGVMFRLGFSRYKTPCIKYTIEDVFFDAFANINLFDMIRVRLDIRDIQDHMNHLVNTLFQ